VSGVLRPTPDSDIRFDVWMPAQHWNGEYQGVGNGGFAGTLNLGEVALSVQRGYASATTDTGHPNVGTEVWAKGHPEKIRDYAERAIHLTTVTAKAIITAYYGRAPRYSYFAGCSNGGRQGLIEAQRYPDDFDGIISVAPSINWANHIFATFTANAQALFNTPGASIPVSKVNTIAAAVMKQCDELDGVKDGVLNDPRVCTVDTKVLKCSGEEDRDDCLTQPQIDALQTIYRGPRTALGAPIEPGFLPGGELDSFPTSGWASWFFKNNSIQVDLSTRFMRDFITGDPSWNFRTSNIELDIAKVNTTYGPLLNADDPDLSEFFEHGGKLMIVHGWAEPAVPPLSSIGYYEAIRAKMGKSAEKSARLFMVPGMQHCIGGAGAYMFNAAAAKSPADPQSDVGAALEAWVKSGRAPQSFVAWKPADLWAAIGGAENVRVERTSLICAYPKIAVWDRHGNPMNSKSYACQMPRH
jgi:feruloyl esterase